MVGAQAPPTLLADIWIEQLNNRPNTLVFTKQMRSLAEHALAIQEDTYARESGLYDSLIKSLFYEFIRECKIPWEKASKKIKHPAIQKACQFIQKNIDNSIQLKQIASHSGIAVSHLIHLFHQEMNLTPMNYLMETRTKEAQRLLRETGLTSAEIADLCGFANPQHFSRVFKNKTGTSPRRYRIFHWNQNFLTERSNDAILENA